jgi:hypothetical protein
MSAADKELLKRLGPSDWDLLQRIAGLVCNILASDETQDTNRKRQLAAAKKLQSDLDAFPPAVRFDTVSLRNAQVNPDYEHLWFDLKGLVVNGRKVDHWSVRLACSNVGPDCFGTHPKLEFPQGPGQCLENWHAESRDDEGDKLELRFALPNSMDTNIWGTLSPGDRDLVTGLIKLLPEIFQALQEKRLAVKRSEQDWLKLISDITRIQGSVCK